MILGAVFTIFRFFTAILNTALFNISPQYQKGVGTLVFSVFEGLSKHFLAELDACRFCSITEAVVF